MSNQRVLDIDAARRHAGVLKTAASTVREQGVQVNSSLNGLMPSFKLKQSAKFEEACKASAKQLATIAQSLDELSRQITAIAAKGEAF